MIFIVFNLLSKQNKDYILCGDLNSRSEAIGCAGTNSNGTILERILLEHDCFIINNNEHTYVSFKNFGNYSENLDLAIGSSSMFTKINSFEVLQDEDLTSDHVPFLLELKCANNRRKQIPNEVPSTKSYNYNKRNWD